MLKKFHHKLIKQFYMFEVETSCDYYLAVLQGYALIALITFIGVVAGVVIGGSIVGFGLTLYEISQNGVDKTLIYLYSVTAKENAVHLSPLTQFKNACMLNGFVFGLLTIAGATVYGFFALLRLSLKDVLCRQLTEQERAELR